MTTAFASGSNRFVTIINVSIFGIVGVALLVAGYATLRRQLDFRRGSVGTVGTIVGREGYRGRPVFEFLDRREHLYRVTGTLLTRESRYNPGDKVRVLYHPENPQDAQVDGFFECWSLPLAFAVFGTININVAIWNVICAWLKR